MTFTQELSRRSTKLSALRLGAAATPALPRARWRPRTVPGPLVAPRLAAGRDQARLPSWRPSTGRRTDRFRWEAALGEQPRDYRVRVPHLARPELISAPDRAGQAANQVEQAMRQQWVVAQKLRTGDRLVGVGNDPVPPAAHLVAKHPEARHPAAEDWAFNGHAARRTVGIRDRPGVLDDKASLRHAHDERGVVEVQRPPPLQERVDGLVDAPVQPNQPATRTQRKPVQLDAGLGGRSREPGLGGTGRLRLRHTRHDRLLVASLAFSDPSSIKVAPFGLPAGSFAAQLARFLGAG